MLQSEQGGIPPEILKDLHLDLLILDALLCAFLMSGTLGRKLLALPTYATL